MSTTTTTTTTTTTANTNNNHIRCLICYTELYVPNSHGSSSSNATTTTTTIGITPCHHNEICGLCHLRLRHLQKDTKCPICKASTEQGEYIIADYTSNVIVAQKINSNNEPQHSQSQQQFVPTTTTMKKSYTDYNIWGNDLGSDFVLHNNDMFFPIDYYHRVVQPLLSYHCTQKDCNFGHQSNASTTTTNDSNATTATTTTATTTTPTTTSLRELQDHLRSSHRLTLCQLCVDHQRDFVARLPRYSPAGLQRHVEHSTSGHPLCEFCRPQRFYDITALYTHLNQEHYKCHVCESASSSIQLPKNQYYKHYASLQKHFTVMHYACTHPTCLAARFVVFANEMDLLAHERHVHGITTSNSSTKIQLEFRVASRIRNNNNSTGGTQNQNQQSLDNTDFDYNLDGTPFVPPALLPVSNNNNGSSQQQEQEQQLLHPQHLARIEELRQRAAALRPADSTTAADAAFPTLQQTVNATDTTTTTTSNRLTIGWTADETVQRLRRHNPRGVVTEEDFPSLAAAAPNPKPKPSSLAFNHPTAKKPNSTTGGWTTAVVRKPPPPTQATAAPMAAAASPHTVQLFPLLPSSRTTTAPTTSLKPPPPAVVTPQTTSSARLDLSSAESFPSLGGGSKAKKVAQYPAALAYAQKKNTTNNHVAADNFPVLASPSTTTNKKNPPVNSAVKVPNISATEDFPSLSGGTKKSSSTARKTTNMTSVAAAAANSNNNASSRYNAADELARKQARDKALLSTQQWNASTDSFLPEEASSANSNNVTVHDMKGALGPAAYKLLKQFTREFANNEMAPDAYVDHAASLFAHGYSDSKFWSFVPALIGSCPATPSSKDAANRYMDHLRRMRNGAMNAEAVLEAATIAATTAAAAPPARSMTTSNEKNGGWSVTSAAKSSNAISAPFPVASSSTPSGRYIPPPPPPPSNTLHALRSSNAVTTKKNAWGNGSQLPSTVVRAQPSALSVSNTGTVQPTNRGTATSYMAKEAKEEQWQQSNAAASNNSNNNKKKSKQKNELRSLAFGGA